MSGQETQSAQPRSLEVVDPGGLGPQAAVHVPPRPTPGPELMPLAPGLTLESGLLLALTIAAIIEASRRVLRSGQTSRTPAIPALPIATEDLSPLALWGDRVREALAKHLEPAMLARTTDELAAGSFLTERLGAERKDALIGFLRLADQSRYAGEPYSDPEAESWASRFVAEMERAQPEPEKRLPSSPETGESRRDH